MAHTCQLCSQEYERNRTHCIVCDQCQDVVLTTSPARLLSVQQRLWGKCYGVGDHWEFGSPQADGRPARIMIDGRQKPAAQVALFLDGRPQPSPEHFARVMCGNPMCVRPSHLVWDVRDLPGIPVPKLASLEDLTRHFLAQRAKKAQYQRTYRRRLRSGEIARFRHDIESPAPVVSPPEGKPEAAAVPQVDVAEIAEVGSGLTIMAAPMPAPVVELGALLGGVKLASGE